MYLPSILDINRSPPTILPHIFQALVDRDSDVYINSSTQDSDSEYLLNIMKFLSFNIILAVFAVFAVSAFSEALESTVREVYSLAGTNSTYLQHVNATKLGAGHGNPAPNLDVQTAGSWDPTDFSTPEEFDYYREKGHWLQCLLMMTDEEAGNALPDPFGRTPKSASSQWQGPLWSELRHIPFYTHE